LRRPALAVNRGSTTARLSGTATFFEIRLGSGIESERFMKSLNRNLQQNHIGRK
jgi:hypothetical protein